MTDEIKNEAEEKATKTASKKQETKPAVDTKPAATKKTAHKYSPDELIECRSVFPGKYLFTGPKTKIVYTFSGSGDTAYVEYQDILSAMIAKKKSVMAPYIVVEDEELLEDVHWAQVKKIYDSILAVGDIEKLLMMPMAQFKKNFEKLPIGMKRKVCLTISTKVRDGSFSEMNKIRLVDEACNTNIALLLS